MNPRPTQRARTFHLPSGALSAPYARLLFSTLNSLLVVILVLGCSAPSRGSDPKSPSRTPGSTSRPQARPHLTSKQEAAAAPPHGRPAPQRKPAEAPSHQDSAPPTRRASKSPPRPRKKTQPCKRSRRKSRRKGKRFIQYGKASWYGRYHHGKPTATGEPFNMHAMTAAHKKLPFHTRVRVTRLSNKKKSVVVRINDRGPYSRGRIIDLSKKAARKLKMLKAGVVKVRVEVIRWGSGRRKLKARHRRRSRGRSPRSSRNRSSREVRRQGPFGKRGPPLPR